MQLFGGGGSPQPKPLPAAPAVDPQQIAESQQAAARKQLEASSGGRASTILTSTLGDTGESSSVSKKLTSLG